MLSLRAGHKYDTNQPAKWKADLASEDKEALGGIETFWYRATSEDL
jgi:hypothetical protein